jgi:polar amino acid transport system substrate-binding protein
VQVKQRWEGYFVSGIIDRDKTSIFLIRLSPIDYVMSQPIRNILPLLAAILALGIILSAGCVSEKPAGVAPTAPSEGTLTFYTEQFPPYNYQENGTLKGMSIDLLEAITEKTGRKVTREKIHLVPWTEAYQTGLTRNNTVLLSTARLPERENSFKWAGPIDSYSTVLFARPDRHINLTGPENLTKYRIGVIRDAAGMRQMLEFGVNESQMAIETNASVLITKLQNGEIDLWAYPEPTGRYLTGQQTGDPYMFEIVYTLSPLDLWYAFSRDVPDATVQSFQQALDALKSDTGSGDITPYEQIAARYIR